MDLKTMRTCTKVTVVLLLLHCHTFGAEKQALQFIRLPTVVPNPNPAAPLAAVLSYEANQDVTAEVSLTDGTNRWSVYFDEAKKIASGLPVIGFRPGRNHQLTVTIKNSAGQTLSVNGLVFHAPNIPTDPTLFPRIETRTSLIDRVEPGYRLLNPRRRVPQGAQLNEEQQRRFGESFGMLLMVDRHGTPVWYYQCESRIAGFDYLDNGRILFVTADFRLVEIDLLGNETRSWYAAERPQGYAEDSEDVPALTFHHDADLLPSGNLIALTTKRRRINDYFTSETDVDAPRQTQWVMGDRAIEFTPDGRVLWEWDAFENLPVRRFGYETFSNYWKRRGFPDTIDWSHANSITKLDDGSVMVNFRYQSAIVNFDPADGKINWIFGEPSGWPEELQSKLIRLEGDARWPWHQHAPVFTSQGTLLLFDNGNYRARPFDQPTPVAETRSRAVEYKLDLEKMTARQVWTSETAEDRPLVSVAMGSALELPETGNILAGYGAVFDPSRINEITWSNRRGFNQITRCVEYTRETPSEVVWELELKPTGSAPEIGWNIFNTQVVRLSAR
ncbi:aryl-sulfate sulfotransferase [Roseiconus lacunae]|uniref:Aryl-sulfate sulfotransferase n=1 Tax=Roseiconus lacunae TaxID=2605694 RepID=A0ABT7PSU8_9BACT|nr:aryl-sulfate sulfotransferase [Roseiconus lacunae]MDM4019433.1 aryl-sulfate sulfotransferase [Roseiconus lacunae]